MKEETRFTISSAASSGNWSALTSIVVDKTTGVNYLYYSSGRGGGLTVLVDADGKPIITPVSER